MDPVKILVVCTGNICRSPAAAAILRMRLAARGVAASVDSAGTQADRGRPIDKDVASALHAAGHDASAHHSRPLTRSDIAGADLVLGMERVHVREVVALEPLAWPASFTLKELVRTGTAVGTRYHKVETLQDWFNLAGLHRRMDDLLSRSDDDDFPDPYGKRAKVIKKSVKEIDTLVAQLVDLIWPTDLIS